MPRLVYLAGVGLLVVTAACFLTDGLPRPPGVTEANVRRIKPGMPYPLVRRILGKQHALDDGTNPSVFTPGTTAIGYGWFGPEGYVLVFFDEWGRARSVEWRARDPRNPDRPIPSIDW